MKKLLLIALLYSSAYAQTDIRFSVLKYDSYFSKTNFNFYYGLNESLGAELLINGICGFGFAGTTEKSDALGEFSPGKINAYDLKNKVSTTTQKWFALYATIGSIYTKYAQISFDIGGALYGRHANFLDPNRNEFYHKKDKLNIKPMIGINFTSFVTRDFSYQIGIDTFNGPNIGFIVYF